MRESVHQREIVKELKAKGALVIKLDPGTGTIPKGFPDLLAILPGGRVQFIETKAADGRLSPLQRKTLDELRAMGHDAFVGRAPKEAAR